MNARTLEVLIKYFKETAVKLKSLTLNLKKVKYLLHELTKKKEKYNHFKEEILL